MAAKTPVLATLGGALVTPFTPTSTTGDTFANNGKCLLHVINGSASPITVAIPASGATAGNGADDDAGGAVAAGEQREFGPFPTARFSGTVTFICSSVTTVTAFISKQL